MKIDFKQKLEKRKERDWCRRIRAAIVLEAATLLALLVLLISENGVPSGQAVTVTGDGYIKWVDFNVSYEALCKAYTYDVESYEQKIHLDWIELLAYVAAKNGGDFDSGAVRELGKIAEQITGGETTMEEATKDLKYYPYYKEAYTAVLGGLVGEYEIQETEGGPYVKKYGLKGFSPVAKGFEYSDDDDFGVSREYGYRRQHLGHDMMGQIGSPVVAVESGYVEAIGWNQYGGWRIGIRSFDGKRYYYYAHLRQNYPYQENLKQGDTVTAGEVIGYMGHTGYSSKENVNNIDSVHLHFGLQLIFDESQKEGNNEIWVDCYNLTRFLYKNRSEVYKVEGSKEWKRKLDMREVEANAIKSKEIESEETE
ncbi:MAG: M23 family metallopeptidase [Roseburia sp.]|nr:M23 family metallopeptidase [Roseburia sp.]